VFSAPDAAAEPETAEGPSTDTRSVPISSGEPVHSKAARKSVSDTANAAFVVDARRPEMTSESGSKARPGEFPDVEAELLENSATQVDRSTGNGRSSSRGQQNTPETRVEPKSHQSGRLDSPAPGSGGIETGRIPAPQRPAETAPVSKPREFAFQLADHIVRELQDGGTGVRIQLKPANLGRLEINAEHGAGGVVARIVTESGAVRQFLESNLQVLEQALQDQGLKLERIDVVVNQNLDHRQSAASQGDAHSGAESHAGGGDRDPSTNPEPRRAEISVDAATLMTLGPNSTFHTVA
jgi:flagellar hook-length control protein FliK